MLTLREIEIIIYLIIGFIYILYVEYQEKSFYKSEFSVNAIFYSIVVLIWPLVIALRIIFKNKL